MEDFFEPPRFGQLSNINPKTKTKHRTKEKDFRSVIRTAEEKRNRKLHQSVDHLTLMLSGLKFQELVSKEEENFSQLDTQINQLDDSLGEPLEDSLGEPLEDSLGEPLEDSLGEPLEAPSPTLTEKTKNAMKAFLFSMNKSIVYSIAFVKNSTPDVFSILTKYVYYLFKFMVYLSRASLLERAFFILVLAAINKTTWGNMFLSFIYFIIKRISQFGWGVIKRQYGEEIMKLYNEIMESVKAIGVTSAGYLASTFIKQLVSDSSFQGIVTEKVSTAIHSQVHSLIQENNAVLQEGLKAVIYSNEFKSILLASYASTQLPEQIENFQNFLIASNRQHEHEIEKIISILYRIEQGDNTLVKQVQKYGLVNLPVLTKSAKKILEITGFIPTQHPQVELIEGGRRRKRRTHKKGKRLSTRTRKGGRRSRVKRTHKRKF